VIAALSMYDRPENAAAHDRLWANIRENLGYGPAALTRGGDPWAIWQAPDLVLAQTCGYPYRARLHADVTLIGTPDHDLPDCPAGYYYSVFVVHKDDPRGALPDFANSRFAYNDPMSQSGWAAPQIHAMSEGFTFENIRESGAHRKSARFVADGRADIAALDVISWQIMQKYDDFTTSLRVVTRTNPTPALPFIAAGNANRVELVSAISAAISDLDVQDRSILHLNGLVDIPKDDYLTVATPPAP